MAGGGGQKQGLDFGFEALVGVGDLQFEFEVAEGPQAPQNHLGLTKPGVLHRQAVKTGHLHAAEMGRGLADLLQTAIQGEAGLLAWVLQHCHHHPPEKTGTALDQVQMAQGERIETAWIENTHANRSLASVHLPRVIFAPLGLSGPVHPWPTP